MYKLSESVEFLEIEHNWTKLWPSEGGGPNGAFDGQKSIGSIIYGGERCFDFGCDVACFYLVLKHN